MVLHEPYELRRVATDSLRPHPNRHLLPALTDRELERLRASIVALGIITPLHVLPDDDGYVILCGHGRHRVAIEVGLATVPVILVGDEGLRASPQRQIVLMVEDNATRRHLTESQRAIIWTTPEVVNATRTAGIDTALEALVDKAGVTARTVADAMLVRRRAPEKVQAIMRGDMTAAAVAWRVRRAGPPLVHVKVNAGELTEAIRTASAMVRRDPTACVSMEFVSGAPVRVRWSSGGEGGVAHVTGEWEQQGLIETPLVNRTCPPSAG